MSQRIRLFGVDIDPLRMPEAISTVFDWVDNPALGCRYVVTPNVDHTILLEEQLAFRDVYRDAGLVLADGAPVVLAARLLGRNLPERVAGSDLVPALFTAAQDNHRPLRIYLLGAMPGVAEVAKQKIESKWPQVSVVGLYSPPLGFEQNAEENDAILARIAEVQPDVLIVGLGAPKQEYWVHAHREKIAAPVALCVGATIDFLAGSKHRAPVWMRKVGLEWAHRLSSEPKRLLKRYVRDAVIFPQLVWREWRASPHR